MFRNCEAQAGRERIDLRLALAVLPQVGARYPSFLWRLRFCGIVLEEEYFLECCEAPSNRVNSVGGAYLRQYVANSLYRRTHPDDSFVVPPMSIHLMLREDGDFTLNRFFILLLAHLTFFPRRIGTPPFDQILEGAKNTGTTLRAYQYTRDPQLTPVPEELYKDRANLIPLTISITDDTGNPRGELRYFPWIDGAVLAWSGNIPLPPLLIPLGDIGLKMMTHHGGVEYSNPIALTQSDFRQWPERLITNH